MKEKIIYLNKIENGSDEKTKGGMKADTREFLTAALQALAISAIIAAFAWLVVLFFKDFQTVGGDLQTSINQEKVMKQRITEGVITDKRIENGKVSGGIFNQSYVPTAYRIYVTNDYEFEGEMYTGEVYFEVSETVYNNNSIGEWFDSQSLSEE
ncbi:MAG: hypothetical protein NC452_01890 [Eubacterium sp.]|nr:hypothetical protein [Eubacterium sp.]